jgi:hypothetical protein
LQANLTVSTSSSIISTRRCSLISLGRSRRRTMRFETLFVLEKDLNRLLKVGDDCSDYYTEATSHDHALTTSTSRRRSVTNRRLFRLLVLTIELVGSRPHFVGNWSFGFLNKLSWLHRRPPRFRRQSSTNQAKSLIPFLTCSS